MTGSGHPTCGFVYKLVAREGDDGELVSVAKKSHGQGLGRRPQVRPAPAAPPAAPRRPRSSGSARRRPTTATTAPLLVPLVRDGEVVGRATLDEARARHRASLAELPRAVTMMSAGEPVIPTVFER